MKVVCDYKFSVFAKITLPVVISSLLLGLSNGIANAQYARHEHPWLKIPETTGLGFFKTKIDTQQKADKYCSDEYYNNINKVIITSGWASTPVFVKGTRYYLITNDGFVLKPEQVRHIWGHLKNRECIANT
ncbi:MAG: hypothetical protein V7K88_19710 [Nostoc sp.]|uniref:hypothetical protein n=1 Tax=Nostoc sp. TaxID=1180 RepID=UPI002FFBFB8B